MRSYREVAEVKAAREQDVLKHAGITGVDVGYKYKDGEKTGDLAIRVYVEKKKPLEELSKSERIPKTMNGIKTDVIERTVQ